MKRINIYYWVFTGLLIPSLGYGSIMELMGNPQSTEIITSLGYPAYLSAFLGAARILALIAIFTPKFPRLKEWAYAGLVPCKLGVLCFYSSSVLDDGFVLRNHARKPSENRNAII